MLRASAAVLLTLAILVPAAESATTPTEATLKFTDLASPAFTISVRYTDGNATDLRHSADADHDGTVSAAEVDSLKGLFALFGGSVTAQDPLMDGKAAKGGALKMTKDDGLAGPVASPAPIDLTLVRNLTYAGLSGTTHTLTLRNPSAKPAPIDQVLFAPPGHTIQSHTGFPAGATVSASKDRLTYREDGSGAANLTITYKAGSAGSTTSTSSASSSSTSKSSTTGTGSSTTGSGASGSSSTGSPTTGSGSGTSSGASSAPSSTTNGTAGATSTTTGATTAKKSSSSPGATSEPGVSTSGQAANGAPGLPQGDVRTRPAADASTKGAAGLLAPVAIAALALAAARRRLA